MSEKQKEKKQIRIRLHVYNTEIPVIIMPEEEEMYRRAAKMISDTVNTYANKYHQRYDLQTILYMSLLDVAIKFEREHERKEVDSVKDILADITKEIEEALSS